MSREKELVDSIAHPTSRLLLVPQPAVQRIAYIHHGAGWVCMGLWKEGRGGVGKGTPI